MASQLPRPEVRPPARVRLLLIQLGYHAARRLNARLEPLGLEPRHYGVLRAIAAREGATQQAVGSRLDLAPPRMVALIDDLEKRGLVERRRNPSDRPWHLVGWGATFNTPEEAIDYPLASWDEPAPPTDNSYARQEAVMCGPGRFEQP